MNTFSKLALSASALCISATASFADQVIADDLIVQGSACIGFDCSNGESFGFDTLRLKENNLRIHFDDTSTSASFPRNDWRILANDTGNGGDSYLGIEDSTAGRRIVTFEAGAPANAMVLDSAGRLGMGIDNPVVEMHIRNGDSPTLRLDQDGSSGFAAQTWDLAGNEANFFVRDVTNGSQLPLKIKPGADSDSLVIAANNDVGVGTQSPSAPLHVRRNTGVAGDMLRLENNEGVVLRLVDTAIDGQEWTVQSNNGLFRMASPAVPGPEMTIDDNGNVTITGTLTTAGSCSVGCDRVFDEDYDIRPIEVHAEYMWANKHLPAVGPTSENGPMNISDKVGGILNELEHAHIYIEELNRHIKALEIRLDSLEDS